MGDRGNVFVVDRLTGRRFEGLYMYAHWSGSYLPRIVRAALKRGEGRWGQSNYLARIVFCEMIKDSVLDDTGYGIGTEMGDNGHKIIRINDLASRVSFHIPGKERSPADKGTASWSYEEFVKAKDAVLNEAFLGRKVVEDNDDEDSVASPTKTSPKKTSPNKTSPNKTSPNKTASKKKAGTTSPPKTNARGSRRRI